ncbi:gamma subclass chorismate mutase AroQ [Halomonas sp. V046]|uniref:gamma subclass chorismate mutase AroQ n=1 Tax=Halomonas sp. V046 TaxID=3459611 RepID=UPI004043999E
MPSLSRFRHPAQRHGIALLVLLALLLTGGCQSYSHTQTTASADTRQTVDRLLGLIDERLAIAADVAMAKWNSGAPINAPEREAQILARVVQQASAAGVDSRFAEGFFQDQFDASKTIQQALHQQWTQQSRAPFDDPPDLGRDVRPQLDELTPRLFTALKAFQAIADAPGAGDYLTARGEALAKGASESQHPSLDAAYRVAWGDAIHVALESLTASTAPQ